MARPTAAIPHELLLDLYAGVTDSARWQGVLDRVCCDLGVRSAVVQRIQPLDSGALATRWVVRDSYSDEQYSLHDAVVADAVNPRMYGDVPQGVPPKRVIRDSDNPRMAGERGRRFQEALRSVGLGEYLSGGAPLPGGDALAVVLHGHVDDRQGYGAGAERYVGQLTDHLRQAMLLGDVLEAERSRSGALRAVIDRMRYGVVICDARGRIAWISERATRLLAGGQVLAIRDGCLAGAVERDAVLLQRLLESCLRGRDLLGWASFGTGHPDALHGRLIRLDAATGVARCDDEPYRAQIALFLHAPGAAPFLECEAVGRLLGVTPAEARLTAAICEGISVKEYARARGLSEGTVRFQLKQVLAKTGAARQADLVRQVCSSLVMELAPGQA